MTIYNRAEKKEFRDPMKDRNTSRSVERVRPRETSNSPFSGIDPEFHYDRMTTIKQLNGQQGLYDNLMRILRRSESIGEISRSAFNEYKALADKEMQKAERAEQRKAEKEAQKQEQTLVTYSDPERDYRLEEEKYRERKAELDERRVRGEDIEEEQPLEKEGKLAKLKKAFAFLGSPLGRVSLFIVLGLFLIFYLTKGSMSDVIESPFIIILAVLFIILILGRGGKTRSVESNNWF